MICEYCKGTGVRRFDIELSEAGVPVPVETDPAVCELCDGNGVHRTHYQTVDSVKRWSVLRVLDLTYMEHKHRDRFTRAMGLFGIVPMVDEPEVTKEAQELLDAESEDVSEE
jgi:predicted secreted protein